MTIPYERNKFVFGKIKYWFQNYFYYYKWRIIIVGFFAAVLIFLFATSSDPTSYDVTILYAGPTMLTSDEKVEVANAFRQVMSEDYDGKEGKQVDFIDMPAFSNDQIKEAIATDDDPATLAKYAPYTIDEVEQSFSERVMAGDAVICLLDRYWYELLLDAGGLVPLYEILGESPEGMLDEYGIYLSDLPFGDYFSVFEKLPEDTILCFRTFPTTAGFTGRKAAEANYERAKEMLRDLFAFS